MSPYLAEFIGTALLVLLGDGVVANVVLHRSKGNGGGWVVITLGWGLGVAMAIYCVGRFSGGHLNPAVTLGLAAIGNIDFAFGLEVAPVRGNAVFFSYDRAHASTKTLHGGAPVTAGEKWVATKWLRERVFT